MSTHSFGGTAIPFFHPVTGRRELELLTEVMDSNYLNDGPMTRRLETMVAAAAGTSHCVGVTSGTSAIALSLMALGIGAGDEVLVPDLTFIATANAVRLTGADVRLVDVDPHTFNMAPAAAARAIGPRTRAMVPVDVNGRGAAYAALGRLCDEHDLAMVCDSAEALGSGVAGRRIGGFGNTSCFSFSANKRICTGQGGAVTTDDGDLHERLRELKDQGRRQQGSGGDDTHDALGFNFKLTNLQAALGVAQMECLAEREEHARWWRRCYTSGLAGLPSMSVPEAGDEDTVLQWFDLLVDDREQVSRTLREAGIGHRAFWRPLHTQTPYLADPAGFPVSTDISARGLWLPSSDDLSAADIETVCATMRAASHTASPRADTA